MAKVLMLLPMAISSGLQSSRIAMVHTIEALGVRVCSLQPIGFDDDAMMTPQTLETYVSERDIAPVVDQIIEMVDVESRLHDVIVLIGLPCDSPLTFTHRFNRHMARSLNADIVVVMGVGQLLPKIVEQKCRIILEHYQRLGACRLLGFLLNKIGKPAQCDFFANQDDFLTPLPKPKDFKTFKQQWQFDGLDILAAIPWMQELNDLRYCDVIDQIQAQWIYQGQHGSSRIRSITVVAKSGYDIATAMKPGQLIITASDRRDVLMAACLAFVDDVPLAGVLITGGQMILDEATTRLCKRAFDKGLSLAYLDANTYQTCLKLSALSSKIPQDDEEKLQTIAQSFLPYMPSSRLSAWLASDVEFSLNPSAFKRLLHEKARAKGANILLPEGDDPRIIEAACLVHQHGLAKITLLGKPEAVTQIALNRGIDLHPDLRIIDPQAIQQDHVQALVDLRAHKGMTLASAQAMLEDVNVLAMVMLKLGVIDGVVSGAKHTTASVLRPALQLIKTRADQPLVSSVFLMCFQDTLRLFADCAVNPDPDANDLASIALQTALTASYFGLEPKVALISYATGQSAHGGQIDKVHQACRLLQSSKDAQSIRGFAVDGPLQYDAAINPEVAAKKAANSSVAGKANVLIFPDLNTGNTTYKAVQRSAGILCIGPLLQGLDKPVNDLSRGASIQDMVYTIALTAMMCSSP